MNWRQAWRGMGLLAAGWALVAAAWAAEPAGPAVAAVPPFGVSIHQITDPREWQWMADAGLRLVRMDLRWDRVERIRGQYDWAYEDRMLDTMAAHGLRPLLILDYGNLVYSRPAAHAGGGVKTVPAAAPTGRVEVDAFAAFARAAVLHFRSRQPAPLYEIWNEPENDAMWLPRSDAAQFVQLAVRTCEAMREADPQAVIYAPGAAVAPTDREPRPPLLQAMLASPLAVCLTGVTAHPYLFVSKLDDSARTWQLLRDMMPAGAKALRLASSESGVSTFRGQVSEQQQAAYLARMMLLGLDAGLDFSVWYDWRDDGDDGDDPQHRFGLLRRDHSRKPAWQAMQALDRQVRGWRVVCRLSAPGAAVMQLLLAPELAAGAPASGPAERARAGALLVAWRGALDDAPLEIDVPTAASLLAARDLMGEPLPAERRDAHSVRVPRGPQPVYLQLGGLPQALQQSWCLHGAEAAR